MQNRQENSHKTLIIINLHFVVWFFQLKMKADIFPG